MKAIRLGIAAAALQVLVGCGGAATATVAAQSAMQTPLVIVVTATSLPVTATPIPPIAMHVPPSSTPRLMATPLPPSPTPAEASLVGQVGASSGGIVGAVLGGPEAAFIQKLGSTGPDTVHGALDHFARCSTGADQYMVTFVNGRASSILRQYCGTPSSREGRIAEARTFFPLDAPRDGTPYTNENGDPAWSFVRKVLGAAFDPSEFHPCQEDTPTGTFELDVTRSGWQLGIGKCP